MKVGDLVVYTDEMYSERLESWGLVIKIDTIWEGNEIVPSRIDVLWDSGDVEAIFSDEAMIIHEAR